jgi:uncharacterized protein YfkK (UPF0435 family)
MQNSGAERPPGVSVSLDDIHDVDDYSEITVRAMIGRLQRSSSPEHLIYRETELDEMWRVVDIAVLAAQQIAAPELDRLTSIRNIVQKAHDLVGVDSQPLAAAEELRKIWGD